MKIQKLLSLVLGSKILLWVVLLYLLYLVGLFCNLVMMGSLQINLIILKKGF